MPIQISEDEIRAVYRQGEDAVVSLITMLIDKVNSLESEVNRLKCIINKDSHNSSKPPSSDRGRKPQSLRKKGKRKSGGQPGHKGHTLKRVENPDHTVKHTLNGMCECGKNLRRGTLLDYERRQVADIPPIVKMEYTDHCAEIRECECGRIHTAPFPEGVTAPVQYGERIRALMVYLSVYQLVPQKRSVEMLHDIFSVDLSEGTLNNTIKNAYQKLEVTEGAIKAAIRGSPVMNLDETGMYVNGHRIWEHTSSTHLFTYYFCHDRRGREAIESGGMLEAFFGTIVHDGWKSYIDFDCLHALCNAHHLRELVFIKQHYKQEWAACMIELLCRVKQTVDRAKNNNRQSLAPVTQKKYKNQYEYLLSEGYCVNPAPDPNRRKKGQRGRLKQHPARNLLDRLKNHEDEVLAFMYDFYIPFDNNPAERDLRMTKVKQKIFGCFRSQEGADAFCRIRGYISTIKKHGQNVLKYLHKVFQSDGSDALLPETT